MPGSTPPTPDVIEVVSEVVYLLGLSIPLGIGMTFGALTIPESRGGLLSPRVRTLALPAAVIVVLGAVLGLRAAAHATAISFIAFVAFIMAAAGLLAMRWTTSRMLARGVAAIAILAAVVPQIPLAPLTLTRAVTTALTTVHLLGAMTWVGGLVVLAATAVAGRRDGLRSGDEWDRITVDWARVWERFSLVAMVAVGALIVSGTWLAWSHVGTPGQLLTTAYGRALAVKLVLVLVLVCAGAYNVRVLLPRIHALQQDGDGRALFRLAAQHFPTVVLGEAMVGVCVLAVVPFLHGSARAQAGGATAVSFDWSTFGTGVVLIAVVAAAMWAGTRRSFRPLRPSTPTP